jgi:tetratricopeptide (TPR) repeat protein
MSDIRLEGPFWTTRGAAQQSDPLRATREQLQQAEQLRLRGELDRARAICEPLVARHADYFGALHTLGMIYADKGNFPMALGLLVRAAMLNPRSWTTLTALSGIYLRLGAGEMAAHTLEQARSIKPQDAGILMTLGEIYRERREYELARNAYREALALEPDMDAAAVGLGASCNDLGQYEEAAQVFEGFIRRGIRSLGMLFELNLVPLSLVSVDILDEVGKVVRGQGEDQTDFEASVAFIRAAWLDKTSRHAEAWQQLVPANEAMHRARQAELRDLTGLQHASLASLREAALEVAAGSAGDGKRTISLFILGPSRSGKTSLETLLGTLDGVKRGYENPIVENAVRRTFQSAGFLNTADFAALPAQFYALCRDIYLDDLARRTGPARVFTNAHPAHIHNVGRIAAALPDARFIFVKRSLEDNALRIYMRKYKVGNPYAYDLKSIREHLAWYHQMIDLLVAKLPGISRVIHYEDMVADPAAALRAAAELCGLPAAEGRLPTLGDDRGCAAPYRELMAQL